MSNNLPNYYNNELREYNSNTYYNNNNFNNQFGNQKNKSIVDSFVNNDFSSNNEPILVYDSFDDDSDDIDAKEKSKKKKNNKNNKKPKKVRKIFQIVKDRDNDKKQQEQQQQQPQQQQQQQYPQQYQQQYTKPYQPPQQNKQQPQQQVQPYQEPRKMQQQDQYGVVPRLGTKTKTIIIQDEQGKELSRIVSSTRERQPLQPDQLTQSPNPTTYTFQPSALNSLVYPQNTLQSYMLQPAPMMLPPQPYYVDPATGYYLNQIPSSARPPINRDIIYEDPDQAYKKPNALRKMSTRGKVADTNTLLAEREATTLKKSKRKQESYIFCCEFCDRPTTDTCECCWKICACPTWWALLISLFVFLSIGGLVAVIVLFKYKIIT